MLGYVSIDKQKLSDNEKGLFQTFMCGICISTKKLYGNLERNIITNDVAILGILVHSYCGITPTTYNARCISSPLRKRSIFARTELFDKLAAANVMLAYHNLKDDLVDGHDVRKKVVEKFLVKSYRKARETLPTADKIITDQYDKLRKLEKQNSNSLDAACEPSAIMLESVICGLVEVPDKKLVNLCYNLGKWVYLIDALDDLKKDVKSKNYNPLLAYFGDYADAKSFVINHEKELEFIFYSTLNQIATDYNDLNLQMYRCVLDNVIYHGIRNKTQQILDKYREEK